MRKGDVMPNGFVLGRGRSPMDLTEAQIRYAMKNSKSNSGAARFLNISLTTYAKYSKRYIDEESGKTLWDIQKNKRGLGISKPYNVKKGRLSLEKILNGEHPEYPSWKLKQRLLNVGDAVGIPPKCNNCGYEERRITDNIPPLILVHENDDWTDHRRENIQFLCYNCYHNLKGNIKGIQPRWRIEQIEKARKTLTARERKRLEQKNEKE